MTTNTKAQKNTARDQYLTIMLGECWHKKVCTSSGCMGATYACEHCGKPWYEHAPLGNHSLATPVGFFKLLEWARSKVWWADFWLKLQREHDLEPLFFLSFLDPATFADAIYAECLLQDVIKEQGTGV